MLIIDYSKTYKSIDLETAIRAAREALARVDFPRRISALATSTDRAAALEAWQRVEELARWLELHAEDDEARDAAREAVQLARRERERLASLPMADDRPIEDVARREIIAATDGHVWKTLPPTVRAAIRGRYVPASPDITDMADRLDADVLALSPARIVCAPRDTTQRFTLNTK